MRLPKSCALPWIIALGLTGRPALADEAAEPEVLTKGPVHEAFAAPVPFNPEATPVVPKSPPAPVEEIAPDTKPEGDRVQWISGYWSWDEERKDFIWVSGVWRAAPPGKKWISGTWKETGGGWQWTPGYWAPEQETQPATVVHEAPPKSLETGPTSSAPSDQYVWVSGAWMWTDRWMWRPGYWMIADPDWVWAPAYWAWTPGGWVFVDGYWDYVIVRRGWLFAPVYYGPGWIFRPGWRWRPTVVIQSDLLVDHFFVYPRWRAYYFGDYYAASYVRVGIHPWFSFHLSYGYDPIWAHHAWYYGRSNPRWSVQVRETYAYRQQHVEARPPPTMTAQQSLASHGAAGAHSQALLAHPVHEIQRAQPSAGFARTPPQAPIAPKPVHDVRHPSRAGLSPAHAAEPRETMRRIEPKQEKKEKVPGPPPPAFHKRRRR
jgi:YXWGXW repeat-containing protein